MCYFHQIYNDFLASGATLPSDPEAYRQSNWQKKLSALSNRVPSFVLLFISLCDTLIDYSLHYLHYFHGDLVCSLLCDSLSSHKSKH